MTATLRAPAAMQTLTLPRGEDLQRADASPPSKFTGFLVGPFFCHHVISDDESTMMGDRTTAELGDWQITHTDTECACSVACRRTTAPSGSPSSCSRSPASTWVRFRQSKKPSRRMRKKSPRCAGMPRTATAGGPAISALQGCSRDRPRLLRRHGRRHPSHHTAWSNHRDRAESVLRR